MMPTAILFDLDDTLADRTVGLRKYADSFHAEFCADLHPCSAREMHEALLATDDFGSMDQARRLANSCLWRNAPDPSRLFGHWNANFGANATCFPGCLELLNDLCRISVKLGLISNGRSAMQRSKIAALGIEPLMDTIIISSEIGLRKPDPRIFALALERLGCAPAEAWFVGDHPDQDVRGAASAGLTSFWVKTRTVDETKVPGTHLDDVVALRGHLPALG